MLFGKRVRGKEGGVPLMRSLTVSYCTFLLSGSVFVSHFYEANEHSTYRYMPPRSSKHTVVLSHTVMHSEIYPRCYGCQQYLKKDKKRLYLSLSVPFPHTRTRTKTDVSECKSAPLCPSCCFLATLMGAGGHQVAETETATFNGAQTQQS